MNNINSGMLTLILVFAFVLPLVLGIHAINLKSKRAAMEVIRHAIDRGQRLDPFLVDALLGTQPKPKLVRFGGIMAVAAGIGVSIFSWLVGSERPVNSILGAGIIMICAGLGLLIGSRYLCETDAASRTDA